MPDFDVLLSYLAFTPSTRGLKSYIILRHKLGYLRVFCGHKYLKSRIVVAILNFSKITCTLFLTSEYLRPPKN